MRVDDIAKIEYKNDYIATVKLIHNWNVYHATLIRPLFKNDEEWYLCKLEEEDPHYRTDIDIINSVRDDYKYLINELKKFNHFVEIDKRDSMFFSLQYLEHQPFRENFDLYLSEFCTLIRKHIEKEIPCLITYDNINSEIKIRIPFIEFIPTLHLSAFIMSFDSINDFIVRLRNSLKRFVPNMI